MGTAAPATPGTEESFAELPSARVRCFVYEGEQARTAVFLHGLTSSARTWAGFLPTLPDGVRGIAYDSLGSGFTERRGPRRPIRPADQRVLLAEVIDHFGAETVVLVGHSLGCRASLDYAWREPQRVRALLLMAPAVMGRERLDPLIRLAQSRAAPLLELLAPLMVPRSARAAVIEYAGDHEVSQRELEDQIGHARQRPRELMRGYVDILAGRDVLTPSSELEHYRSIEAPVTILRGSGDLDWTPESHEQRYRDLLANLRLERWDGVSHAPQIQAPERFRSALNAFLDKTLP